MTIPLVVLGLIVFGAVLLGGCLATLGIHLALKGHQ